jgi:methane monooxygenase component A gamma chain
MARATKTATEEPVGAAFRLEPSPFGNQELRAEWVARIDSLRTLPEALECLQEYRLDHSSTSIEEGDVLWIEARLEDKVATLRFEAMTAAEVRSRTLVGESVAEVCADFITRSEAACDDWRALEELCKEFRTRYKPPVMPSSPFLRTETILAELLMRSRSLDWYGQSLEELREERGVIVHKAGD